MKEGSWLAFDSYSTHASNQNNSGKPRIALKIVFGEKENFNPRLLGRLKVKTICSISKNKSVMLIFFYVKLDYLLQLFRLCVQRLKELFS